MHISFLLPLLVSYLSVTAVSAQGTVPRSCLEEGVTTGTECQEVCSTILDSASFSFSSEIMNLVSSVKCTCGSMGVYCQGSPPDPTPGTDDGERKSCVTQEVLTFDECSASCERAIPFGATGAEWSLSTLGNDGPVAKACCVCTGCGVFCEDNNIINATSTCGTDPELGTCPVPEEITTGGDGLSPPSCSAEEVLTPEQCSTSCDGTGATGSSFSSITANGLTRTCCKCNGCGVFCRDNSDTTCTSTMGVCAKEEDGGGGDGGDGGDGEGTEGGGGGMTEEPLEINDGEPKSCTANMVSSISECTAMCAQVGATNGATFASATAAGLSSICCTCTGCGVYCRDNASVSCVSDLGVCGEDGDTGDGGTEEGGGSAGEGGSTGEEASEGGTGGPFCFPGDAMVQVRNGATNNHVMMKDLKLGYEVLVAGNTFEPIYSFGHYLQSSNSKKNSIMKHTFLEISTDATAAPLVLTKDHMVFRNNYGRRTAVPASLVRVGDELLHVELNKEHTTATVRSIRTIQKQDTGLFAPFTPSGMIVVNGIQASNFVTLQEDSETLVMPIDFGGVNTGLTYQFLAHTFEAPHRLWCATFTSSCHTERYTTTGISTWVDKPHQIARWMFENREKSCNLSMFLGQLLLFVFIFPLMVAFTVLAFPVHMVAVVAGIGMMYLSLVLVLPSLNLKLTLRPKKRQLN